MAGGVFLAWEGMMNMICNVCKRNAEVPKPLKRTEGDLEIGYIVCPSCSQEYIISVTDPALRKQIKKYLRLSAKIRKGNAKISSYQEAEKLKTENVTRSKELIEQYLGLE